jgi:hypothetical protein
VGASCSRLRGRKELRRAPPWRPGRGAEDFRFAERRHQEESIRELLARGKGKRLLGEPYRPLDSGYSIFRGREEPPSPTAVPPATRGGLEDSAPSRIW